MFRRAGAVAVSAALIAGSFTIGASPAFAAVPDPSLKYTFNELSLGATLANGSAIADTGSRTTASNGTVQRATATVVAGVTGAVGDTAIRLPGGASNSSTAAFVQLPNDVVATTDTAVTITAWTKWEGATGSCQSPITLGKSTLIYLMASTSCGNATYGAVRETTAEQRVGNGGATLPSKWTQIALVYDVSAHTISYYVNGVLDQITGATGAQLGTITGLTQTINAAIGTNPIGGFLGKSFYADPYYIGAIDDVKIYSSALSQAQIAEAGASNFSALAQADVDALTVAPTASAPFALTTTGSVGASAISWTSSNPSLVSVNGAIATVTRPFGGTAPTATLTASAVLGGVTQTKTFTVAVTPVPITSVTVSRSGSGALAIGATEQLTAQVVPSSASQTVSWSTSDSAVASVSAAGLVTAVATGSATITATSFDGSQSDTVDLAVNSPSIAGVKPTVSGTAEVGSTLTANAGTWTPADATLSYQWRRSGASIGGATSSTYVLTASDIGSTITVRVTGAKTGFTSTARTSDPTQTVVALVPAASLKYTFNELSLGATLANASAIADTGTRTTVTNGTVQRATATVVAGVTGEAGDTAIRLPGGASSSTTASYVNLPNDIITSSDTAVTVTMWTKWEGTGPGACQAPFALGKSNSVYVMASTSCGGTYGAIGESGEQRVGNGGDNLPVAKWAQIAVVYDVASHTASYYVNGVLDQIVGASFADQFGTITGMTKTINAAIGTASLGGYLGKSFYADPYLIGAIDDVKIYNSALTQAQVAQAGASNFAALAQSELNAITVPSTVTADFTLPTTGTATTSSLSWASSKPSVISINGSAATVTRPIGGAAPTVTLTATAVIGNATQTKTFAVDVTPVPISSVTVTRAGSGSVLAASTEQLTAVVAPTGAPQEVTWTTSDDTIATVSSTGLVTGVAAGAVTITATSADGSTSGTIDLEIVLPSLTSHAVTIEGTAKVGSTLTATTTTWTPAPVALAYTWSRDGVEIDGATSSTYVLTGADAGAVITVTITGTKSGYSPDSSTSDGTAAVALGDLTSAVPTMTGDARFGGTLTAAAGTWGPGSVDLAYQWYRGDSAIAGATSADHVVQVGEVGSTLRVVVTGSKPGYAKTSTEVSSSLVQPASLTVGVPSVGGAARVGSTLTGSAGIWAPSGLTLSWQWLRNGAPVPGAVGASYLLTAADQGTAISLRISGSQPGFASADATSAATTAVAAGTLAGATPKVSGTAKVGKKLTVKAGTWKPTGVAVSYQWFRSGKAIKKATKSTYTLVAADRGKKITVKVTGKKAGYTTLVKTSKSTKKVAK